MGPPTNPARFNRSTIQSLDVKGLELSAQSAMLADLGVSADSRVVQAVAARFGGNPLAIRIVAAAMADAPAGEAASMIERRLPALHQISHLIDEQLASITPPERELLEWLTILRVPSTALDVWRRSVLARDPDDIVGAADLLGRRALMETAVNDPSALTLQPSIMSHIERRLVQQAAEALRGDFPGVLHSYPLYEATALDYVRGAQRSLLLRPVLELLLRSGTRDGVVAQLRARLDSLRSPRPAPSYAAGNLLNMLILLGADLAGADVSDSWIRGADFRDVEAPRSQFSRSHLQDCLFPDVFDTVMAIALHPNHRQVAAAGVDGTIRAWSLPDCLERRAYGSAPCWIRDLQFDSTGLRLAAAGDDGCVRIWDWRTTGLTATLDASSRSLRCVAFVGDRHLVAGSAEGRLHIWDLETGNCRVVTGHAGHVRALAVAAHGERFVSGGDDGRVCLWSIQSNQPVAELGQHRERVRALALSPDRRMLASGAADRTINVWNLESGELVKTLIGHTQWIASLAFCGRTGLLASSSGDKTIRIWNVESGDCMFTLGGHARLVWVVRASDDGRHLVSGGDDQSIRVWDLTSGQCLHKLSGHTHWVTSIAACGASGFAVGRADRTVRVWDSVSKRPPAVLHGHEDWVTCLAGNRGQDTIVSGSDDCSVRVWTAANGRLISRLQGHTDRVRAVALSKDGRLIASGGNDRTVKLWSARTGESLATLVGHTSWVRCLAFAPAADILVSGSDDQTIRIWSLADRACIGELHGHSSVVRAIAFAPGEACLFSGSNDRTVRVWSLPERRCLTSFEGHTKAVLSVGVSPDGSLIASGGEDGTVRLWSHSTAAPLGVLSRHASWVTSVVLLTQEVLLSGSQDGSVRIWNLAARRLEDTLTELPYAGMRLDDVSGLDQGQVSALVALGADVFETDRRREQASSSR